MKHLLLFIAIVLGLYLIFVGRAFGLSPQQKIGMAMSAAIHCEHVSEQHQKLCMIYHVKKLNDA